MWVPASVDRSSFYARRIHEAMTGPNKNDQELVRLFVNLRRTDHFKVRSAPQCHYDAMGRAPYLFVSVPIAISVSHIDVCMRIYVYVRSLSRCVSLSTSLFCMGAANGPLRGCRTLSLVFATRWAWRATSPPTLSTSW
jgi:hypothetical protein